MTESFIYDSLAKFSEDMTVEREIIRMSIFSYRYKNWTSTRDHK